jgi:uncharacterized iron-regulated membrane protein
MKTLTAKQLYSVLWRWHFYAGIFAIPFVIILAITGAIYLFKPQIDELSSAPYRNLPILPILPVLPVLPALGTPATADAQVATALSAVPGSTLTAYQLPRERSDAATILVQKNNETLRVYVHPHTLQVLAVKPDVHPLLRYAHAIHGELLLGKFGSILVELAACWAIVLVLTGVYLWCPRNAKGLAGILYPRLSFKGRLFWRDLHSVTGIWISFFVLFLLISGLPWALVWGNAFNQVRELTGTTATSQDWAISGHHHPEAANKPTAVLVDANNAVKLPLDTILKNAEQLHFAHPVLIRPPIGGSGAAAQPWIKQSAINWTVSSTSANRTLNADAELDPYTGALLSKSDFSQKHIIDRAVGIGISAHEGQLFGWLNQLIGLLTAMGLVLISITGFVMWRKRAPNNLLGAPPKIPDAKLGIGFVLIIGIAALLLPVLGMSLIALALLELLVLSRSIRIKTWLGLN